MKKLATLFLAATLLAVPFAGCSGSGTSVSGSDSAPAASTSSAAAPADSSEPVEISFMDISPRPEREAFFQSVITKFNAENPNITVDFQSVPWDDAATKLTNMAAAKQLPDVVNIYGGWFAQFKEANWIIPLDDYIAGAGLKDKSNAITNGYIFADQIRNFGSIYAVPDGIMTNGIYVRSDWLKEAGITLNPNWTWDEYFDTVAKLTDPAKKRYGISYRGARGAFDRIAEYLSSFTGGRYYDDEGNCLLYSPEQVEHFIKFTDMYKKGYGPEDSINWGFTEMVDNFTGGLTGTLNNDTEVVAICQERMEEGTWEVMPLPCSTVDGKVYGGSMSSYNYSISSFSTHQDQAWAFIEFLSRPENNAEYCKVMTLIPFRTDIGDDPLFAEDGPLAGSLRQLNNPKFATISGYGAIDITDLHQGPMHSEVQLYLQGKQSADETLKKLSDELTARMKAHLEASPDNKVPLVYTVS